MSEQSMTCFRGQPVVINLPSIFQDQMTNTSLLVYQFQVLFVFLQSLRTTGGGSLPLKLKPLAFHPPRITRRYANSVAEHVMT